MQLTQSFQDCIDQYPCESRHKPVAQYSTGHHVAVGAQCVAHPGHGGGPVAIGPGPLADSARLQQLHHLPDPSSADGSHTQCRAGELGEWLDGILLGLIHRLCPLMGLFNSSVSRGRSIRELGLAVAILCPIVTNLWFTQLGGTGLHLELAGGGISEALAENRAAAALLTILSQLPLAGLLIPIGLVLVVLFMCTSADSMSYSAAMVVSGRNEPAALLRLFWALMIGSLTLVLLHIGMGLGDSTSIDALQASIVMTAVMPLPINAGSNPI